VSHARDLALIGEGWLGYINNHAVHYSTLIQPQFGVDEHTEGLLFHVIFVPSQFDSNQG